MDLYDEGRLSVDWKKIKKEYIAGGISQRKLAEKHGVSRRALERKASEEGWVELRRQTDAKTTAKAVEAVSSRNARLDKAVDLALEAACKYLTAPGQLRAVDLKDVTTALKNLRDLKGLKSEADMEEQRARIEALRARAGSNGAGDDEDGGGGVMLMPEAEILAVPQDNGKEGGEVE